MSSHNTLGRMTDMLFEELERLNAVDVTDGDALAAEVERSRAMQGMAKEINARGYSASSYNEFENKHMKISTFLRKWWGNVVFLSGTDKAYIAQILSYTEGAEHDDAPDSAACVVRYFDRR